MSQKKKPRGAQANKNRTNIAPTSPTTNGSQEKIHSDVFQTQYAEQLSKAGVANLPMILRDSDTSRVALLTIPTVSSIASILANGDNVPTAKDDGTELTDNNKRAIYVQAEALLQQISLGALTLGMLTQFQKDVLYCYFSNFNPVVKRILSLFTQIVVSPISIQKPKLTTNDVVQDYIKAFFDKMADKVELNSIMNEIVYNRLTYGRAYI
jgi:methyl coenzyme M reductase subunit D